MEESHEKTNSFVTLTEASPAEAAAAGHGGETCWRVVVGSHVRQHTARRSGMLSGLRSTQGAAELPSQLSPDDVQLWQAACSVDCELSTSQLVTVLQVADLLGDVHVGEWVDLLAGSAMNTAWAATTEGDWPQCAGTGLSEAGRGMLCALLQLPGHLLRRVLTACLRGKDLDALLSELPPTLHPALVSARAATGSITLPTSLDRIHMVLLQLASMSVPSPGLLSLSLPKSFPKGLGSDDSGALLAHAVSAQPTLTNLDLGSLILPVSFYRQLTLGLKHRSLPSLRSLQVAIHVHPNGVAAVVSCLKHLSALTYCCVDMLFKPAPSGASGCIEEYVSLVSFPAKLPDLQRLNVRERHYHSDRGLQPSSTSVSYRLFPLLIAPQLTYISFTSDAKTGSVGRVAQSMCYMPALQTLHIDADMNDDDQHASLSGHRCASDDPKEGTIPDSRLRSLSITSACIVSPVATASTAAKTSITSLIMGHVHRLERRFIGNQDSDDPQALRTITPPDSDRTHKAWADLFTFLPCCCQLQDLHLSALCSSYADVSDTAFAQSLAAALSQLTKLTSLHMTAACRQCYPSARCQLQGELLRTALQGMTLLRELSLCGSADALTLTHHEGMLAALPGLQLTAVGLCFGGLQQAQLSSLLPKLKSIQKCTVLAPVLGATDEEAAAFKARFPRVEFGVWDGSA